MCRTGKVSLMIYGIGTDICEIKRIAATLERRGERFAQKILTINEFNIWQERRKRCVQRGLAYLATRFSAKESFAKALGLGLRLPMSWQNCAVISAPSGQPSMAAFGALKEWMQARNLSPNIQLSLSEEQDYAISFCIVCTDSPSYTHERLRSNPAN